MAFFEFAFVDDFQDFGILFVTWWLWFSGAIKSTAFVM